MRTIKKKTGVRELHKSSFSPKIEVAFLLQDWTDPYNVGGLFRVADACGAKKLMLTGRTPCPPHPQVHVTSMGHHRRVPWQHCPDSEEGALAMIDDGWTLIAVEIATEVLPFTEIEYPKRTCFVLGNEVNGVYSKVLKHCSCGIFIPMAGKGRSLNVHVSAAIVAFHALLS